MLSLFIAVSIDCPNVINLAFGFNMNVKQPAIFSQLQSDCCAATGVSCVSQRVFLIDWYGMDLDGVINGTAIPSNIINLWVANNELTGSIPDMLPIGLVSLNLDINKLSGDLPQFPSTLESLGLGWPGAPGNNHFTGTVRMNRPTYLRINYNWITDVLVQDSSSLITCDLSYNPLLSNPNLANLPMCTKTGLYSANMLPITRSAATIASRLMTTRSTIGTRTSVATKISAIGSSLIGAVESVETTMVIRSTIETMTDIDKKTLKIVTSTSFMTFRLVNLDQAPTTGTTQNETTAISSEVVTLGTVHFEMKAVDFSVNLGTVLRVFINLIILGKMIMNSTLTREFKRKVSWGNKKETMDLRLSAL